MEEDIKYFKNYKKLLNDFLYVESKYLTVETYMEIVNETKVIETHIKKLKENV